MLFGRPELQFNLLIFLRRRQVFGPDSTDFGPLLLPHEGFAQFGRQLVADVAMAGTLSGFYGLAHVD